MSEKHYIQFPLALLRYASTPCEFFDKAIGYSCVNAGLAHYKRDSEQWRTAFKSLGRLSEKQSKELARALWYAGYEPGLKGLVVAAHLGRDVCGMHGGIPHEMAVAYAAVKRKCDSALVRVSSDIFWAACHDARDKEEQETPKGKRLGWRPFRVLVALLSARINSKGFAFIGWEGIQHRACGFSQRKNFKLLEENAEPWPQIVLPIPTRDMIRADLRHLEANNFFLRHLIGKRGCYGMSAYSFRHESRELLAQDVAAWQAYNRRDIVKDHRLEDSRLQASERLKRAKSEASIRKEAESLSRQADELESDKTDKTPTIPHESSIPPRPTHVTPKPSPTSAPTLPPP